MVTCCLISQRGVVHFSPDPLSVHYSTPLLSQSESESHLFPGWVTSPTPARRGSTITSARRAAATPRAAPTRRAGRASPAAVEAARAATATASAATVSKRWPSTCRAGEGPALAECPRGPARPPRGRRSPRARGRGFRWPRPPRCGASADDNDDDENEHRRARVDFPERACGVPPVYVQFSRRRVAAEEGGITLSCRWLFRCSECRLLFVNVTNVSTAKLVSEVSSGTHLTFLIHYF